MTIMNEFPRDPLSADRAGERGKWFGFYLHEASGPPSYKIKIHRLNYNKRDDNVDGWWRMSRPPLMKMMGSVSALVEGLWPGS